MTFGKNRIALGHKSKDGEYEMIRFAVSKTVVGIASRLLTHFVREYTPVKITTFADKRWSVGRLVIYILNLVLLK